MVGSIIIIVIILIITWILFSPIVLKVDTRYNLYDLRFLMIAHVWLDVEGDNTLTFHLKLPLYHYQTQQLPISSRSNQKRRKVRAKGNYIDRLIRIKNIVRSFKVTAFEIFLDTDNYTLNAQLIPISIYLSNKGIPITINFQEKSFLQLEIRNTPWRLGLAYLKIKKY